MSLRRKVPQMSGQLELPLEDRGETPNVKQSEEACLAIHGNERSGASGLMELVCERQNLLAALKRVRKNKGSPGIDGMTVDELPEYLKAKWPELREQLLSGTYQPAAVKQQLIPKGNGGVRQLGIPKLHSNCTWFQFALGKCRDHPSVSPVAGTTVLGSEDTQGGWG